VDTRGCGFQRTPAYVTSLYGRHNHWLLQGADIVYAPTRDQLTVFVRVTAKMSTRDASSNERLALIRNFTHAEVALTVTPEQAEAWGWAVGWIGEATVDR
jgi:hypothetical protein